MKQKDEDEQKILWIPQDVSVTWLTTTVITEASVGSGYC